MKKPSTENKEIERLKAHFQVRDDKDLAKCLRVFPSQIHRWRKNGFQDWVKVLIAQIP